MIPSVYYELKHRNDRKMLHGKDNKKLTFKDKNDSGKQLWAFIPIEEEPIPTVDIFEYYNINLPEEVQDAIDDDMYEDDPVLMYYCKIKNKETEQFLTKIEDGGEPALKLKDEYADDHEEVNKQRWHIRKNEDGNLVITNKASGKAVYASKDKNTKVFLKDYDADDDSNNQYWEPILGISRWQVITKSMEYPESLDIDTSPVDIMLDLTVRNDSDATFVKEISNSRTKTCSFEWGFVESLTVGQKSTVKAEVPKLGIGASAERSVEMSFEANQKTVETTEETYDVSFTLEVPPRKSVRASVTFDWVKNAEMEFVARFLVSADAYPADSSASWALTTDQIIEVLTSNPEFNRDKLVVEDQSIPNVVEVEMEGYFRGNYGATSEISIVDVDDQVDAMEEALQP